MSKVDKANKAPEVEIDIVSLYKELETQAKANPTAARGEKADLIRNGVRHIAKVTGNRQLNAPATYKVLKEMNPDIKIDRPHFNSTVQRAWEVTRNDDGHMIIDLDKEISK